MQPPLNQDIFLTIYELKGPSLLELFYKHDQQFSILTIFYIGVEMVHEKTTITQ